VRGSKNQKNHYEILGVASGASADEIRSAYRSLVGRYHPDKHQKNDLKDLAVEKLSGLNTAYETLSDPHRRAAYDRELAGGRPILGGRPRPTGTSKNAPPRFLRPVLGLLAMAGVGFLRNPRVFAIVALGVAALWFISVASRDKGDS
jgi:curved DNA-binding protein CbpA